MAEKPRADLFVVVRMLDEDENLSAPARVQRVMLSDYAWRKMLGPHQYRIARGRGTERPFCGALLDEKRPSLYICVCCGLPLFGSDAKFESGTGWPSYSAPVARENVTTRPDSSHGMARTEILCARCDAHLGHVFEDGPAPTGLRYCLNSASLVFLPRDTPWRRQQTRGRYGRATFAAGCFWGVQAAFQSVSGVAATAVGYTGGRTEWPSYEEVCSGQTGHAEAVRVIYDANAVSFSALLDVFWRIHDPTALNRQGPDVGEQYRSAIFCHDTDQRLAAERSMDEQRKSGRFRRPIVTEIAEAGPFYRAEEYHQDYARKHGGAACGAGAR